AGARPHRQRRAAGDPLVWRPAGGDRQERHRLGDRRGLDHHAAVVHRHAPRPRHRRRPGPRDQLHGHRLQRLPGDDRGRRADLPRVFVRVLVRDLGGLHMKFTPGCACCAPVICNHKPVNVKGCFSKNVQGCTVLLKSGSTVVDTQTTDSLGNATLTVPSAGSYTIAATPPAGTSWWNTAPVTTSFSATCSGALTT